jgi:Fe-S oxidoreductase
MTETQAQALTINPEAIRQAVDTRLNARLKMWMRICAHCGLCADTCHFYLAKDKDPRMVPSFKARKLKKLVKKKGQVDEKFMQELYDTAFGECTLCRRCTLYCPFGIDMAMMVATIRSILTSQGMAPEGLKAAIKNYLETGNQMAISEEDWVETLKWMEEELQDELPGATIPIDKKGARIMYTVNAREPKFYPQDIQLAAKVFHVVGEDWTLPSKMGWDDTNLAMFAGDAKTAGYIVQLIHDRAVELGVQYVAITECGHAYRSVAFEGPVWLGKDYPFKVIHSVELFAQYIREGRLKFDRKISEPITYQDPCNVSRSGGLAKEARYIIGHIAEDFREMVPHGNDNYCCSGGGGAIPMGPPFKKRRMEAGRIKAEQVRATGAKIVISPCHNCYDQLKDLSKEYNLGVKVLSFKEIFEETMHIPEELKAKEEEAEE